MSDSLSFFVTCARGFDDLLLQELAELGISETQAKHSGIAFDGDLQQAYTICLWSRLASRVLLKLKSFTASTEEELYRGVQSINWSQHLDMHGSLAVNCTLNRSALNNSHYAALKTKDAIVDQFNEFYETRPSVEKNQPDVRINLHIDHDQAELSIDLSGEPLHKRGYRQSAVQAPLKENLAAAILMRAGWPELSRGDGAISHLLDPMCGSATFLIEAAMMSLDIAPGLRRKHFGFSHWKGHQESLWKPLLAEAKQRVKPAGDCALRFSGYDAARDSIAAARQNIHAAGLQDLIHLQQMDFQQSCEQAQHSSWAGQAGMVIVNPPYGERLGEKTELAHLYSEMGDCWKQHFPNWKIALFSANDELSKHIGLRAHRSNTFFNGAIKCKLNLYQIRPALTEEKQQARDEKYQQQRSTILNRLKKNAKHISRWAKRQGIEAYRVYDADIPEYSAAVDVYGDWVYVQEYQAPATIELARARQRLDLLVDVIPEVLGVDNTHIVVKTRRQQKGLAQYEKEGEARNVLMVKEHELSFIVNLSDYLDTGLFLDHRLSREMIYKTVEQFKADLGRAPRFLNLFAYTASVSVYAAAAGAHTTSVDMSNTYLDWAKRNFKNNQLLDDQQLFIKADCLQWLKKAQASQAPQALMTRYDLIFLDPPTFSNSKSMQQAFDVQKDQGFLVESAMQLLNPGGQLFFSNNFRNFKLDAEIKQRFKVTDITASTLPEDFKRNPKIHHAYIIEHKRDAH